jgi:hypothetical protein
MMTGPKMRLDVVDRSISNSPRIEHTCYFTNVWNEDLRNHTGLVDTVALKVLKQAKWESDIKGFLTSECVVIPISLALLALGSFIPPIGIALTAARVCVIVSSVLLILVSVLDEGELSATYHTDSEKAGLYIQALESKIYSKRDSNLLKNKRFLAFV